MYIVWLKAHDNCHIHYTLHNAIVIARNVFKRSYTRFVNSGIVPGRYRCRREHGDVYTNFKPLARKPSLQTFYIIYIGTFKTAKRLLYLYVLPKRRDVGFSFRDESYFCKCSTMMGGAMKLNYCLPFLQCQSFFDNLQRGQRNTVSRLGIKRSGQYNCKVDGVMLETSQSTSSVVLGECRNGKWTEELLNNKFTK